MWNARCMAFEGSRCTSHATTQWCGAHSSTSAITDALASVRSACEVSERLIAVSHRGSRLPNRPRRRRVGDQLLHQAVDHILQGAAGGHNLALTQIARPPIEDLESPLQLVGAVQPARHWHEVLDQLRERFAQRYG